jgi:hypothetical protein
MQSNAEAKIQDTRYKKQQRGFLDSCGEEWMQAQCSCGAEIATCGDGRITSAW